MIQKAARICAAFLFKGDGMAGKKQYKLYLSERDEYVPNDYLSITQIFTDGQCALPGFTADEWCIGEKALKKMRQKTFNNIKVRFKTSNAEFFNRYWNSNLDVINSLGLNEFARLSFFSELASVMIAFEERVATKTGTKKKIISFGIKKSLYRKYYDNLKNALETSTEPYAIYLFDRKKNSRGNMACNQVETVMRFKCADGKNRHIELTKNDVFCAFEIWCNAKGCTKKDGVYQAMQLIMREHPIAGQNETESFRKKTDLENEEIVVQYTGNERYKTLIAKIDESMAEKVKEIILRYNLDPDNLAKNNKLTQNDFLKQAIAYFIKHLPLKYTDAESYKEYMRIKQADEYNTRLMEMN